MSTVHDAPESAPDEQALAPVIPLPEFTRSFAILKALKDVVDGELERGKAEATRSFHAVGAKTAIAMLPDGTPIAKVTLTEPKPSLEGATMPSVIAYVKEHYPARYRAQTTVQVTQTVPEAADVKDLIDDGTFALQKDGSFVDTTTGEVVPLLAMKQGKPYPSVKFEPGGREIVADAWNAGTLNEVLPPALPNPEED
jgi:hypothetical protein